MVHSIVCIFKLYDRLYYDPSIVLKKACVQQASLPRILAQLIIDKIIDGVVNYEVCKPIANYNTMQPFFFLIGASSLINAHRIASSNTCFRPSCVSAEHSKYL
jgi:hypothetical protein